MNTQLPPELIDAVLAKSEKLPDDTPVVKGQENDNGLMIDMILTTELI